MYFHKINKIFSIVLLSLPIGLNAQETKKDTERTVAEMLPEYRITKSQASNTSTKGTTTAPDNKIKAPTDNKVLAQASPKLKERSRNVTGDQYIPLAGEIDYFGKNNDLVLNYTKSYYNKNFKHFSTIRKRGEKYFKIIDKSFAKREVPLEMKYLSVIESALTNTALSPVGALGPWQFMPGTGQFMGLVVNDKVDERKDWNKSTNAAAKYVNYLYDILQDWLLVVAAYNSGPRPVLAAIKKTGKSDFFVIKKYLPSETQNHVMAFIATATIMERMDSYIGSPLPTSFDWKSLNKKTIVANGADNTASKPKNPLLLRFTPEELKTMTMVRMEIPIDLDLLAITLGEDRRKMGKWNFDYYQSLSSIKSGEKNYYLIRIPKDKMDIFLEKKGFLEKQKVDMSLFE